MAKITGNSLRNKLVGTVGSDTINGLGADDTLFGRAGNDLLLGGVGNDQLFGESGNDTLNGGTGNDRLSGGSGSDRLIGSTGNDILDGGTGVNVLEGGDGNDLFLVALGVNAMRGGAGNDTMSYAGLGSPDGTTGASASLRVDMNFASGSAIGDTFASIENVIGSSYNDSFFLEVFGTAVGGAGDDFLQLIAGGLADGGAGRDELTCLDAGTAVLRGGDGSDTINAVLGGATAHIWLELTPGTDLINGFTVGTDKILLSGEEFGFGPSLSGIEFLNSGGFTGAGPQLRYSGSSLYFSADGAGGQFGQIELAHFNSGPLTLSISDFVIV